MKTILLCPASKAMKKRSERTLRSGCSKAEPKKFRPTADPLPSGVGQPEFNQLEMVTTFTYKPSLDRWTQFRVIIVTDPHTHPQTPPACPPVANRQDRLQYTAPQLALSVIRWLWTFLLSEATSHTVHVVNTTCCPWAGLFYLIRRHARVHDFCAVNFARA